MAHPLRYRPSSPDNRHAMDPMRASTGAVQMSSSYDPYDISASRYGHSGYPSDYPYDPRLKNERRLEAKPVSSKTYRDPGHSTKLRTEYSVRPRERSNTTSGADGYKPTIRNAAPSSSSTLSPAVSSRYGRSPSPLPESERYVVPAPSRRGHQHRRVYSTDYASDTLDPRSALGRHRMGHGAYHMDGPRSHLRYPATGGLKKGEDIDDYDAYSYTSPREQFEKESVDRLNYSRRHRKERPLSLTGIEDYYQPPPKNDPRLHGPPPSQRGFDKLDKDPRPRRAAHGIREDDTIEGSRHPTPYRAPVSLHQADDDGYFSYRDDYDVGHHHPHYRQRHRHDNDIRHNYGERAGRQHRTGDLLVSEPEPAQEFDHDAPPRPEHRRPRDIEPRHSRNEADVRERGHRNHDRRMRRPRREGSDSDASISDEDIRRYRREPSARQKYSGSNASSSSERESSRHLTVKKPHRRRSSYSRPREGGSSLAPIAIPQGSLSDQGDASKSAMPSSPSARESEAPPKGILKPPREKFPEEPNPVREGVAPLKDAHKKGIPPGARWTKIDRRLVNPAALEAGHERFEERAECVIVLRVLSKEEIQAYAVKTKEIRGMTTLIHSNADPNSQQMTDAKNTPETGANVERKTAVVAAGMNPQAMSKTNFTMMTMIMIHNLHLKGLGSPINPRPFLRPILTSMPRMVANLRTRRLERRGLFIATKSIGFFLCHWFDCIFTLSKFQSGIPSIRVSPRGSLISFMSTSYVQLQLTNTTK